MKDFQFLNTVGGLVSQGVIIAALKVFFLTIKK
jgi:hypothetical protein